MRNDEGRSLHARLRRRPLARRIRCCNPIAAPCQARSVRATVVLTGCVALLLSRATGVVAGTLLDHRDIGPDTGQDGNFREGRELPVFLEGVSLVLRPNHRGPSSKWFQSWRCITTRPGLGSSESRQGAYTVSCATCHGENLAGRDPAPPLCGGSFAARWAERDALALFDRIRTTMPPTAHGSLSDATYAAIVAYIRSANC